MGERRKAHLLPHPMAFCQIECVLSALDVLIRLFAGIFTLPAVAGMASSLSFFLQTRGERSATTQRCDAASGRACLEVGTCNRGRRTAVDGGVHAPHAAGQRAPPRRLCSLVDATRREHSSVSPQTST